MTLVKLLLKEMEDEGKTTRKMLERVPTDKFGFKPHPKSMDIKSLTAHIAELPGWVPLVLATSELDFAKAAYTPNDLKNTEELLAFFDKTLADAKEKLTKATDEQLLNERWVLRTGEHIHSDGTKYDMVRIAYSQTIHHRAQLGVFLRLLDIPLPGSYGPTADDTNF